MIGSVKLSDLLTITPWTVICPPGRVAVPGHWASTLLGFCTDTKRADQADTTHLLAMLQEVAREYDLVAKAEARSADVDIWIKLREHGKQPDRLLLAALAG